MKRTLLLISLWAAFAAAALGQVQPQVALLLPTDGDTLSAPYPTFVWNAVPFVGGSSFKLEVYPVLTGQSKQAAVNANLALYSGPFQQATAVTYPIAAPSLTPGHYAWRVVAAVADNPGYWFSEVFEFYVTAPVQEEETELPDTLRRPVMRMMAVLPYSSVLSVAPRLKFYVSERHQVQNGQVMRFEVIGDNGQVLLDNTALQPALLHGDNFNVLDFSLHIGQELELGRPYRLRVLDHNSDVYWGRFVLISNQHTNP